LAASLAAAALSLAVAGTAAPALVFADLLLEGPRAALAPLAARHLPERPRLAPRAPVPDEAPASPRAARPRDASTATHVALAVRRDAIVEAPPDADPGSTAVVLEARPVSSGHAMLPPIPVGSTSAASTPASPWSKAATAGRAAGQAAERTGAAIGDAATRGGTVIGQGAKRTGSSLAGFFARAF
jgi:hypothetical protein